jgi:hypothetical protein
MAAFLNCQLLLLLMSLDAQAKVRSCLRALRLGFLKQCRLQLTGA